MSDMTTGQLIGSIGGTIIGGYFGGFQGAMLGMSIGGMIGGWVDPPDAPAPPPLGDLGINTYVHNAPVTIAYGQLKLYGGCLWIGDMGTAMGEGGSKKNPEYSPQMWLEFAVAHCEGETTEFLKYWINDKVVSELAEEGMTFSFTSYYGTATQSVDPNIDAFLAGNEAPAVPFIYTSYTYVYAYWDGGYFSSVPNFSAEIKALLCESGEEDANPIRVVYDFLTDDRYGANVPLEMFNGDPDTADSSWKIAADYCDESVSYVDGDGVTQNEARFRYSNAFDARVKGFDIVKDILQTCRGIIYWNQGYLDVKIENESETVTAYYSDEYTVDFTEGGSSTVSRIYVDSTITESAGFWEGAHLSFEIDGITYSEMVNAQGTNYFDLVDDLSIAPTSGITIKVTKDNIKEGTFSWKKSSGYDKYTNIRVEFVNRKFIDEANGGVVSNEYIWDVVEHETPEVYTEELNQQQIRLQGIKRKSQAMRMAKWYADCSSYLNYYCEFSTDMVGYFHTVGDIIGVTYSPLGWSEKEFRIVGMEEIDNDEIKLRCLEYSRYIYGDEITQVITTSTSTIPSVYASPDDVERVHVVQDSTENMIYINFKRPDDNNWWVGAQIWRKIGVNGEYELVGQVAKHTSSIKLYTGGIDSSQTTVPFDSTTLYGAFPDTGEFWIEDELISYTSINDTLNQFEGCTRGSNASAHVDTEYCHLKETTLPYVTFDSSFIGTTWYFKLVSTTITGTPSVFADATEVSITLV